MTDAIKLATGATRHARSARLRESARKTTTTQPEKPFRLGTGGAPASVPGPSTPATAAGGHAMARAARVLTNLEADRARMDRVIERAIRGATFSPAQLIALQAQVYRLSQNMEIVSRVLDRSVGALKSVLGTQV